MFPRIKTYINKDGSIRKYLYLVASKRIGGKQKQVVMANLGRVEEAEKNLPDMVSKLAQYSRKLEVISLASDMKNDWVKEYGPVIIFKKIWERLGLNNYLGKYLKGRKMGYNIRQIIFSMILNRLLEPRSELGMHNWIKGIYGLPGVSDIHQWYRSLDFLIENKDKLEKDIHEGQRDLFNQELDVVLMDTTSVVYWGDGEKAEEILDFGYSKQKRFDLKQVIVGILMTKEGMPIGHEVYKGNTNDITAFGEMIKQLKNRFKIRRIIIVCDRGMVSEKNLQSLESDKYEYIVGVKMRQLKKKDASEFLSKEKMRRVTNSLQGKEIIYKDRRYIVCFNEEQEKKDKAKRDEIINRLTDKLKTQGLKSLLVHKEYSKYLKIKSEKPVLDEEKVKEEAVFDGKFVLQSNTLLDWKQIILAYKDLWQVEAAFRTLKNELEMGPIYHYTEHRIRAHIFICFLALMFRVILQKDLNNLNKNLSVNKVLEDVKKIKAVQITMKDKPVILRTELQGNAHYAFRAVKLKIPPRILSDCSDIPNNVVLRV